jgi:hypothetical protein
VEWNPCATPPHHEGLPEGQIEIAPLALVVGKGGASSARSSRRRRAHVERPSLEPRAATARRDEQFVLERVEHHSKFEPSATVVGNRQQNLRKAMREVSGAVERIDNPPMRALAARWPRSLRRGSRGPGRRG